MRDQRDRADHRLEIVHVVDLEDVVSPIRRINFCLRLIEIVCKKTAPTAGKRRPHHPSERIAHRATQKFLRYKRPSSLPDSLATPKKFFKVRRSILGKRFKSVTYKPPH